MKRLFAFVVVFALGFVAGIVWYRQTPTTQPGRQGADRPAISTETRTGQAVSYSGLSVQKNASGYFSGRVTLTNNTNGSVDFLVTVHVYSGPDNVADLHASTTLKPGTASTVDLESLSKYETFTDTTVDLLPLPS